jgi:hypothetical protein
MRLLFCLFIFICTLQFVYTPVKPPMPWWHSEVLWDLGFFFGFPLWVILMGPLILFHISLPDYLSSDTVVWIPELAYSASIYWLLGWISSRKKLLG